MQQKARIEVRIRDRVGVVSEIAREISAMDIPIADHNAHVSRDARSIEVSVFCAHIAADEADLVRLRRRLSRIRGFISFEAVHL